MNRWCLFCAQRGLREVMATGLIDGDHACDTCGPREAQATGGEFVRFQKPAILPQKGMQLRKIAGERVRMSPKSVMGAEVIATEFAGRKEDAMPISGKLTKEQREEICSADPAISNVELASRYGVTDATIIYHRNRAANRLAKAEKPKKSAALVKPGQRPVVIEYTGTPAAIDGLIDGLIDAPATVRVQFSGAYTLEQGRAILGRLNAEQTGIALHAVLAKLLEA